MKTWLKRIVQLSLVATASIAAVSCGTDEEDYCDWWCDCTRCSDREFDDCIYRQERESDSADRYDCYDLLEDYRACVVDDGLCDANKVCRREAEDYARCML